MSLGLALTAAPAARTYRPSKRLRAAASVLQARCRRPSRLPAVLVAEPLLQLAQQAMPWFTPEEQWALALSTFAGLSTTIGALAAIIRRPDDSLLAFLLGTAIGVMFTLSVAEMWVHNAMEHGWPEITGSVLLGALLYQLVQPFLPDFDYEKVATEKEHASVHPSAEESKGGELQPLAALAGEGAVGAAHERHKGATLRRADSNGSSKSAVEGVAGVREPRTPESQRGPGAPSPAPDQHKASGPAKLRSGELLRLGLLMAVTMTLHNLPEGFAVAFSAFTSFGPIMAAAIAVHNIPEGVIVAAPVYAATGSRWKAVGVATASGLSEPLGALLALLVVRPFLSESLLQYILAFVGGIMAAVCVLELWPEARKCRADARLVAGVALGTLAMGWTLWVGV